MSEKKANIRITLQPRNYSFEDAIDIAMDIDYLIGVIENEPANFHCLMPPGRGLVPAYQVLERDIGLVKGRKATAEYLAAILTEKIMECLSKKDRIDGYSKDEWEEMHNEN